MSGRRLARLAAVLAALLLLWGAVALAGRRSAGAAEAGVRLLGVDTSKVDSVVMSGGTRDTAVLARGAGGWTVNGHPAAKDEIAALLRALADTSRSDLVAEKEASHPRLGVDPDSGRRVRAAGPAPVELLVGGKSGGFGSEYARRPVENAVYRLRGELPRLASRPPDDWRDKTIAVLSTDSIAGVAVVRGRDRYELSRDGARWRLARGGLADSLRAAELIRSLGQVSASGFATPAQADSARFARPDRRLTVKGANGRTLLALVFDSTANAIWVRHDSGGTVWQMESWEADRITPPAADLR